MKKVFTIAVCVVFAIVAYSQQIQQITVNATKNVMSVGETMQLTAIISPQEVTNNTLTWSSSNPTIATVNTAGIVTAVSAGSVNIIASANDGSNVTGSFQLVISSVPITSITIGGSTAQMQMGQTIQLSATILPTNATNKSIYWSSLSPNVASVDQTGKVTALSTGTTTIKAMSQDGSGVYAFFDITVISYITIENVVIPLKLYKTTVQSNQFMIDYEVYPQTAPNKNVTWTSTNPQVASVDATGKVKPLSIGTTVIWAISQADITKKDSTVVEVEDQQIAPTSIIISQKQLTLAPSSVPFKLYAEVLPLNATNKNVIWQVMNSNVVEMIAPGEFIAKAPGTTEIIVTTEMETTVTNNCYVVVQPIQAQEVVLSRKELTMQLGNTTQIQAYIKPLQTTLKQLYWTSSNNSVVSVNTNGDILAVGVGTAYVYAQAIQTAGVKDSCLVTVVNEEFIVHKQLPYATITIGNQQNTKFTISEYITYNGTQSVSYEAISTNPSVARAFVQGPILGIIPYTAGVTTIILQAKSASGLMQMVHATFTIESAVSTNICSSLQIDATIQNVSCAGGTNGYAIVNASGGKAPYTYKWSNFRTDNAIKNVPAGQYRVVVTDANNCTKVEAISITEPAPMQINGTITQPTCGESNGAVTVTVEGGTAPYTYAWDIPSYMPNIIGLDAGLYSVIVKDAQNCEVKKTFELNNTKAPIIFVKDITETNCNPNTGAIDIDVTGGTGELDYTWSNGVKTQDLSNVAAGNYSVTVTDENLCKSSAYITIPSIPFEQPDIALVTVGDTSKLNLIVWEKELTEAIDFYTIYRETSIAGVFESIGTQPYTAPSLFADPSAIPSERSYRYRISATHNCGGESALSAQKAEYKTINLQTQVTPDSVVFNWDSYEGFDFYSYVIYKRVNKDNVEIARVPSTKNSYVYYTKEGATSTYFVGIELPKALNPKGSAKIESGPFVLAMSNLAEAQTSIAEIALQKMYAYPSIVKSMLTIVFDNQSTKNSVQIYTLQGLEVYNSSIVSDSEIRIPATVLTSGMYVVKITSNGKQTLQSIVVE